MGEELTRLVAQGFEIYHDVPFERKKNGKTEAYNIDHVLVGPAGVFSIETKTRRKPVQATGTKEYRVGFDGQSLHWPWGTDTHGLEQAFNNAKTLSEWLRGMTGDPVSAIPILTLPGWLVDRSVQTSRVQVLNPKEIFNYCSRFEFLLDEKLVKRICYALDQKCRIQLE